MALIGIDLGTTNSLMSMLDDSGNSKIVHNKEGKNLTPSVVWIQDQNKKSIKVGEEAKNVIGQEENVFFEFKRTIGSPKRYPFFDSDVSSTELSAFVLQKLKNDFESSHGKITDCVITVPANFANEQREATLAAAKIAGLNTKNLVNEPTAAALYYVMSDNEDSDGVYMVFDFGGGTFDTTIVNVKGTNIDVMASEGLKKCGGADLDEAIIKIIQKKFKEETGEDLDLSKSNFSTAEAEEVKISLSNLDEKKVTIMAEGQPKKIITVTRKEFESEISGLLTQMQSVCEIVLEEAKIDRSRLKEIFLAGGSSRVPCVQSMLEKFLGRKPKLKGNPDEAISQGAAIYAGLKTDKSNLKAKQSEKIEEVKLQEVAPAFFGTIALDANNNYINVILIKKNENIPCSVTESLYTIHENQEALALRITQSPVDETDPRFVRTIWEGELKLPGGRPPQQEVKITYAYKENGLMNASFEDVGSGNKQEVDITAQSEGASSDIDINDFIVE